MSTHSFRFWISTALALSCSANAFAQFTDADFRQEERALIEQTRQAFDMFTNRSLPDAQRIRAVEDYASVGDERQLHEVTEIVQDPEQSDRVRAVALSKLKYRLIQDPELYELVLTWVRDVQTPNLLRRECLSALGLAGFTSFGMQVVPDDILETYRALTDDPDREYRRVALNYLASRGDDFAQQVLIEGLRDPARRKLEPAESIALLGYDIHGDHYPVIYQVLQETEDMATRLEAVRVLGNYSPARSMIVEVLTDEQQNEDMRIVAMKTLNAFAQDDFSDYVEPLLSRPDTPEGLLIYAMNAERFRRNGSRTRSAKYTDGRYVPDSFDQSVIKLRESNPSESARRAAEIYLKTLDLE